MAVAASTTALWLVESLRSMTEQPRRPLRRGDAIPPVSDYAHWNEDAELMWYQETRHDMMYADEILEEPDDFLEGAYEERYDDGEG
jgi:hypothetical protein